MRCTPGTMLLCACVADANPLPPDHPYLAPSAWPITHGNAHAQSASALPGPTQDDDVTVSLLRTGLPSVTLAFEPSGERLWAANPLEVLRVTVSDPPVVAARLQLGLGVGDLFSGAYTLLDVDGRFFLTNGSTVRAFEAGSDDGIVSAGVFAVDAPADGEVLRGLGITWDGALVTASSTGRVFAVDRGDLTVLSEVSLDEPISNSIAVDERGGVYVVTSEAMYRLQWTGAALSMDSAQGAWRATYEGGAADAAGGRLGTGSGSTPTLMTVGDDALVLITDGQDLMHLVAFWRDAIPDGWTPPPGADPRTAALVPVTFGDPSATSSRSEQSVVVLGDGAAVVNNDYGEGTGIGPVLAGIAPPGVERFTWDARRNALTSTWSAPDLSCPNGIPSVSQATLLLYCVGKRGETWTVEGIDWLTGASVFTAATGASNDYNSVYAATEIGPDGALWTGTVAGILRVGPTP